MAWDRQLCLVKGQWTKRGLWQCGKFSAKEGGAKKLMKLLRACGSAEFGKEASGSATHGLWLGNRKVRFQVVGEDRGRLPEKMNIWGSLEKENEDEETATERRVEYTESGLDLIEREEQVACHSLAYLWQ